MKISSRVDACVSATLTRKAATAAVVASGTSKSTSTSTTTGRRRLCSARDGPKDPERNRLASSFICSRSSQWLYSTFMPTIDTRPSLSIPRRRDTTHCYSTVAAVAAPRSLIHSQLPIHAAVKDKHVLLSYVPPENEGPVQEYFEFHRDPYRRGYAPSDGPKLQVSDSKHDVEYPQKEDTFVDNELRDLVTKICAAIGLKLRHPHRTTLEAIYKLYCRLPEPRMLNLTGHWRNRLMRVMGTPQKREMESMLRYFALVTDVKNAGLTLRRTQWNYALAFATKYAARAGAQEMESALRLWRQMEREAQVKGNDVTFNVLFDVAAKAGNFTLAEMIYKEMDNRGIEFNRFHHVSLIHYFGLKLDSAGIRAAYREMVESGEMIDTVALNCVISGFLRCGEEAAAEETYERMKSGNSLAPEMPERNYMLDKMVTKVLMMFSRVSKDHPSLKQSLQTNVQLAPDLRTYILLVEHYAIKVGDLGKVAKYLDEMKYLKIPIHPTIFLALFKGFYVHGGFEGAEWSRQRLEGVLAALYDARDEHAKNFRLDRWMVIWALRAVRQCSTTDAVLTTYDEMQMRWDIPQDRVPFMQALLENVVTGRDLKMTPIQSMGTLHRAYNKGVKRSGDLYDHKSIG